MKTTTKKRKLNELIPHFSFFSFSSLSLCECSIASHKKSREECPAINLPAFAIHGVDQGIE